MQEVEFVVEEAGCSSCADRVRRALEAVATVVAVEVDDAADVARARLRCTVLLSEKAVERVLREASVGSGHGYRVQPGSWRALSARG